MDATQAVLFAVFLSRAPFSVERALPVGLFPSWKVVFRSKYFRVSRVGGRRESPRLLEERTCLSRAPIGRSYFLELAAAAAEEETRSHVTSCFAAMIETQFACAPVVVEITKRLSFRQRRFRLRHTGRHQTITSGVFVSEKARTYRHRGGAPLLLLSPRSITRIEKKTYTRICTHQSKRIPKTGSRKHIR